MPDVGTEKKDADPSKKNSNKKEEETVEMVISKFSIVIFFI